MHLVWPPDHQTAVAHEHCALARAAGQFRKCPSCCCHWPTAPYNSARSPGLRVILQMAVAPWLYSSLRRFCGQLSPQLAHRGQWGCQCAARDTIYGALALWGKLRLRATNTSATLVGIVAWQIGIRGSLMIITCMHAASRGQKAGNWCSVNRFIVR